MEQKKPIILQVDESTKKMVAELEGRISEGFADTLGDLKGKISSSSDAIDALRTKLNRINDIQDSVDESSAKSDEIKRSIENLINVVSRKLNVDAKEFTSDNPLDKQATNGDIDNSVRESLVNLENLKDFLTKSLSGFGERHLDSFTNLSSLIENVKSSISTLLEKQNDIAGDVTSDFKNIVDTIDILFAQGKEQLFNIESAIKDAVNRTGSNIRQQFEQNQSALKSQSEQLSQNTEALLNILESLSTSFQEVDGKLKDLANSLAASHKSYRDQMGAYFDSSRNGIKTEFAHLNTIICENEERLIANTKAASDRITNNTLSAKSEILSDNQEKAFQTLSSIKEFREFVDNRVTSVERECSAISKEVESFKEAMASEVSIIKENQEYIQNTLNEVLYHSIPFWRFKVRKAVKQLKKQ